MVNEAFNNPDKEKVLVPKDHKDIVSVICKLRNDLHFIAEYRLKPWPAFYGTGDYFFLLLQYGFICLFPQAVWVAVVGWVVMGTVANQSSVPHRDAGTNDWVTFFLSFPGHQVTFLICFD